MTPDSRTCIQCGAVLGADAKFCRSCGTPMAPLEASSPAPSRPGGNLRGVRSRQPGGQQVLPCMWWRAERI